MTGVMETYLILLVALPSCADLHDMERSSHHPDGHDPERCRMFVRVKPHTDRIQLSLYAVVDTCFSFSSR